MSVEHLNDEIECLVIGAGVIGLAIARILALRGHEVLVVERERAVGTQTSSRNSEVIHAGVYYAPGSLKAQSCVAGAERLYRYCGERAIRHHRCGKFLVATEGAQIALLQDLHANARRCGVTDLVWLTQEEARSFEPQLQCAAVLYSPSTGIIDSHEYLLALLGDAQAYGASVAFGTTVVAAHPTGSKVNVSFAQDAGRPVACRWFINAAGLDCTQVAAGIAGLAAQHIPRLFYAKGSYFTLRGGKPFDRLIYPVPEPGGLGVHMTLDLGGRARFGPDVEWVDGIDYAVEAARAPAFYAAIRRYWPGLEDGRLEPAYAGVRPKLSGPQQPAADFGLSGPRDHGVAGVVNLFGIESPGLTAALDIAERVRRIVENS